MTTATARPDAGLAHLRMETQETRTMSLLRLKTNELRSWIVRSFRLHDAAELPDRWELEELLNDFVLVSDAEISAAVRLYLEHTHSLVEGAGAAALTGAVNLKDRLAGKRVVVIASGANLAMRQLRQVVG